MKNEITQLSVLGILFMVGIVINGFIGGALAGGAATMILLVVVGKRQAKKAIDLVDRRVKNVMLNNMK